MHTAIVVACIMTLKPLVTKFFPNLLTPRSSGGDSTTEPSAVSGGLPLTIGSKPSRQPGQMRGNGEDVMLGDIEHAGGFGQAVGGGEREKRGEGSKEGSTVSSSEGSVVKNGELEVVYGGADSPWVRGDAVSTEDLGRLATARSIG